MVIVKFDWNSYKIDHLFSEGNGSRKEKGKAMGIFSLTEQILFSQEDNDGHVDSRFEIGYDDDVMTTVQELRNKRMEAFKNNTTTLLSETVLKFEVQYKLIAYDVYNDFNHTLKLWSDLYIEDGQLHQPPHYVCYPEETTASLLNEWKEFMNDVTRNGAPKVLMDIQEHLREFNIQISDKVEGEGRGGSLKDEGSIKRALMNHETFQHHIIDEKARKFGDMVVLDYDKKTKYVVNIKTSIGSTDNAFSKAGIVYALTNLPTESIPSAMNFAKMNKLIDNHRANVPGRDYWFLCVDKKDSSNVMVRGAKQIRHWIVNINPSNVLQIDWKKEKKCLPVHRTWEESYDVLVGGAKKSLKGFFDSLPQDWQQQIMAA